MRNLPPWAIRTINAFCFIQDYEFKPVMAFGNKLVVVGLSEPIMWIAQNDNGIVKIPYKVWRLLNCPPVDE